MSSEGAEELEVGRVVVEKVSASARRFVDSGRSCFEVGEGGCGCERAQLLVQEC